MRCLLGNKSGVNGDKSHYFSCIFEHNRIEAIGANKPVVVTSKQGAMRFVTCWALFSLAMLVGLLIEYRSFMARCTPR